MADNTTPNPLNVDMAAYEDAANRVRELNERILEGMKTTSVTSLDAYEKALQSVLDFEQKVAGASQLDWVTALTETHVTFVQEVSAAYTKAARDMLS